MACGLWQVSNGKDLFPFWGQQQDGADGKVLSDHIHRGEGYIDIPTVQEMCVSRPLVMRGIFARKRENAKTGSKTRKRENRENAKTGSENAKTRKARKPRKRENAHGSTRARKLDSYDHLRI